MNLRKALWQYLLWTAPALAFGASVNGDKAPSDRSRDLDPNLPTIFIAGDSTAAANNEQVQGWGIPFASYFDLTKVNIVNSAQGGRSSRTFVTAGDWSNVLAKLKSGDVVLIQFGHNDGGSINDEPPPPLRARGSLPGIGEETEEIENVVTKKHEVVHTFGWYLRTMIADTKARGARPVLLSPTVRNIWTGNRVEGGPGNYREWVEQVATAAGIPFVDVTLTIARRYEALGPIRVKELFPHDNTHTTKEGAKLNAEAVVSGLASSARIVAPALLSALGRDVVSPEKHP